MRKTKNAATTGDTANKRQKSGNEQNRQTSKRKVREQIAMRSLWLKYVGRCSM